MSVESKSVAILAIGSELLEGQIADTNSKLLSELILSMNGEVSFHLSCKDERADILDSLKFLRERVSLVITIGGLGPTTDDLTRSLVAEFSGKDLVESAISTERVVEKLSSRGIQLTEGHYRQGFYPEGAVVYENSAGTADGFSFSCKDGLNFLCLPGPPIEIKAILDQGASRFLKENVALESVRIKRSLAFLGIGESQIASEVERLFPDFESSIGYRASAPFVEVKVWLSADQWTQADSRWESFKDKYDQYCIGTSIQDFKDKIKSKLNKCTELQWFHGHDDPDFFKIVFEQYLLPLDVKIDLCVKSMELEHLQGLPSIRGNELQVAVLSDFDGAHWNIQLRHKGEEKSFKVSHHSIKNIRSRRAGRYLVAEIFNRWTGEL